MVSFSLIPTDTQAQPVPHAVHALVLSECSGSWTSYGPAQPADDLDAMAERAALLALGRLALATMRTMGPEPLMVDKTEAARRCGLSVASYDKYAKRGFLPRPNLVGRISIEALKRACMKLDGLPETEAGGDPAERALREWESK